MELLTSAVQKLRCRYPEVSLAIAIGTRIDRLEAAEEECTESMPPRRRAEFTAGRLAARHALSQAGHAAPVAVTVDDEGLPVFPKGYVGSIAHKHGRGAAIAARATAAVGIGIDLEFDENHDEASLIAEVVTRSEQASLAAIRASEPDLLSVGTLVLAAKEALYKAVFQVERARFDFEDAELRFAPEVRGFRAVRFPGDERLKVEGGYELVGRWLIAIALARR